jgi:hypothetical protein
MALTGCELKIYELEVALEQKLKADGVIFERSPGIWVGPIRPFKPGKRVRILNNVHNVEGDIAKGEIIASILDCAVVFVLEIKNKDMLSEISLPYHKTPGRAPQTVIVHKSYLLSADGTDTVTPDIPYYTTLNDKQRPEKFAYGNMGDQMDDDCKSRKSMLQKVLAFDKRVSLHDYEIRTGIKSPRNRSRSPSAVVVSPVVSPVGRRSPSSRTSAKGERKRVTFKGGSRSKRCKRRRMTRRLKRKH